MWAPIWNTTISLLLIPYTAEFSLVAREECCDEVGVGHALTPKVYTINNMNITHEVVDKFNPNVSTANPLPLSPNITHPNW